MDGSLVGDGPALDDAVRRPGPAAAVAAAAGDAGGEEAASGPTSSGQASEGGVRQSASPGVVLLSQNNRKEESGLHHSVRSLAMVHLSHKEDFMDFISPSAPKTVAPPSANASVTLLEEELVVARAEQVSLARRCDNYESRACELEEQLKAESNELTGMLEEKEAVANDEARLAEARSKTSEAELRNLCADANTQNEIQADLGRSNDRSEWDELRVLCAQHEDRAFELEEEVESLRPNMGLRSSPVSPLSRVQVTAKQRRTVESGNVPCTKKIPPTAIKKVHAQIMQANADFKDIANIARLKTQEVDLANASEMACIKADIEKALLQVTVSSSPDGSIFPFPPSIFGQEVSITSHRMTRLEDDGSGGVRVTANAGGAGQRWRLRDAGDGKVRIENRRRQPIIVDKGKVVVSAERGNQPWMKWTIASAGGGVQGRVFITSARNLQLEDRVGTLSLTAQKKVPTETWIITATDQEHPEEDEEETVEVARDQRAIENLYGPVISRLLDLDRLYAEREDYTEKTALVRDELRQRLAAQQMAGAKLHKGQERLAQENRIEKDCLATVEKQLEEKAHDLEHLELQGEKLSTERLSQRDRLKVAGEELASMTCDLNTANTQLSELHTRIDAYENENASAAYAEKSGDAALACWAQETSELAAAKQKLLSDKFFKSCLLVVRTSKLEHREKNNQRLGEELSAAVHQVEVVEEESCDHKQQNEVLEESLHLERTSVLGARGELEQEMRDHHNAKQHARSLEEALAVEHAMLSQAELAQRASALAALSDAEALASRKQALASQAEQRLEQKASELERKHGELKVLAADLANERAKHFVYARDMKNELQAMRQEVEDQRASLDSHAQEASRFSALVNKRDKQALHNIEHLGGERSKMAMWGKEAEAQLAAQRQEINAFLDAKETNRRMEIDQRSASTLLGELPQLVRSAMREDRELQTDRRVEEQACELRCMESQGRVLSSELAAERSTLADCVKQAGIELAAEQNALDDLRAQLHSCQQELYQRNWQELAEIEGEGGALSELSNHAFDLDVSKSVMQGGNFVLSCQLVRQSRTIQAQASRLTDLNQQKAALVTELAVEGAALARKNEELQEQVRAGEKLKLQQQTLSTELIVERNVRARTKGELEDQACRHEKLNRERDVMVTDLTIERTALAERSKYASMEAVATREELDNLRGRLESQMRDSHLLAELAGERAALLERTNQAYSELASKSLATKKEVYCIHDGAFVPNVAVYDRQDPVLGLLRIVRVLAPGRCLAGEEGNATVSGTVQPLANGVHLRLAKVMDIPSDAHFVPPFVAADATGSWEWKYEPEDGVWVMCESWGLQHGVFGLALHKVDDSPARVIETCMSQPLVVLPANGWAAEGAEIDVAAHGASTDLRACANEVPLRYGATGRLLTTASSSPPPPCLRLLRDALLLNEVGRPLAVSDLAAGSRLLGPKGVVEVRSVRWERPQDIEVMVVSLGGRDALAVPTGQGIVGRVAGSTSPASVPAQAPVPATASSYPRARRASSAAKERTAAGGMAAQKALVERMAVASGCLDEGGSGSGGSARSFTSPACWGMLDARDLRVEAHEALLLDPGHVETASKVSSTQLMLHKGSTAEVVLVQERAAVFIAALPAKSLLAAAIGPLGLFSSVNRRAAAASQRREKTPPKYARTF